LTQALGGSAKPHELGSSGALTSTQSGNSYWITSRRLSFCVPKSLLVNRPLPFEFRLFRFKTVELFVERDVRSDVLVFGHLIRRVQLDH
jgi:hypothetical protein